jgi:nicotinamide-nucleotide amidase
MSTPARRLANAEIIAVGTEMLRADRTDTNSLYLTGRLNEIGIEVLAKAVVADKLDVLAAIVRQALDRTDLVILTGGLGPTDDDLTRTAVASVLGRGFVEQGDILDAIRTRFEQRGMRMPELNRRQAQVIEGAVALANRAGTAPGMWVEHDGKVIVLLPGPPREMRPMFDDLVEGRLGARAGQERLARRTVRIVGLTESHAEERLQPMYARWADLAPPVAATILAARGQVELQLTARAREVAAAERSCQTAVDDVVAGFGLDVCSTDGRELERVVGDLLRDGGLRVAVAESCTGGLVLSRLTDVPGSSDYVERGVVAYSNRAKTDLLGVPAELIDEHGAVSEPVAAAMADGARRAAGVEMGVGITGIAGPGGGSEAKPVGTVAIAVAGPGPAAFVRTIRLPGTRHHVKLFSSTLAIDALRRALLAR